jgi:hypothetical protein
MPATIRGSKVRPSPLVCPAGCPGQQHGRGSCLWPNVDGLVSEQRLRDDLQAVRLDRSTAYRRGSHDRRENFSQQTFPCCRPSLRLFVAGRTDRPRSQETYGFSERKSCVGKRLRILGKHPVAAGHRRIAHSRRLHARRHPDLSDDWFFTSAVDTEDIH